MEAMKLHHGSSSSNQPDKGIKRQRSFYTSVAISTKMLTARLISSDGPTTHEGMLQTVRGAELYDMLTVRFSLKVRLTKVEVIGSLVYRFMTWTLNATH